MDKSSTTTISEQIGTRLRAARKAAGYKSAKIFASQHGIAESTYSQHETGKRTLNADMLFQYSNIFGISPGWLLTGEGAPYSLHDRHKEQILYQELQDLKNYSNFSNIPPIQGKIALVDMDLLTEVLREIAPMFSDSEIHLTCEELIEFCIDIYNSVITTTSNKEDRKSIIELSVSSLKRGIKKNKGKKFIENP